MSVVRIATINKQMEGGSCDYDKESLLVRKIKLPGGMEVWRKEQAAQSRPRL